MPDGDIAGWRGSNRERGRSPLSKPIPLSNKNNQRTIILLFERGIKRG